MSSLLDVDLEQRGDLTLSAPDFDDGDRMPDYVGAVNDDENPRLEVGGVPADAESLVLVMDDPDTREAVGFTIDHWLVWDVDPAIDHVPRDWDPEADGATVGYNDMLESAYVGPAPPSGEHAYRFKLLALDGEIGLPPQARKAVLDLRARTECSVLAGTQLVGTYDSSQGTIE